MTNAIKEKPGLIQCFKDLPKRAQEKIICGIGLIGTCAATALVGLLTNDGACASATFLTGTTLSIASSKEVPKLINRTK